MHAQRKIGVKNIDEFFSKLPLPITRTKCKNRKKILAVVCINRTGSAGSVKYNGGRDIQMIMSMCICFIA